MVLAIHLTSPLVIGVVVAILAFVILSTVVEAMRMYWRLFGEAHLRELSRALDTLFVASRASEGGAEQSRTTGGGLTVTAQIERGSEGRSRDTVRFTMSLGSRHLASTAALRLAALTFVHFDAPLDAGEVVHDEEGHLHVGWRWPAARSAAHEPAAQGGGDTDDVDTWLAAAEALRPDLPVRRG